MGGNLTSVWSSSQELSLFLVSNLGNGPWKLVVDLGWVRAFGHGLVAISSPPGEKKIEGET